MVVLAVGVFVVIRHRGLTSDGGTEGKMSELFAEPRLVELEKILPAEELKSRSYPGTAKASREALLSFRVGGPLVNVDVQPGDLVKKGKVLMKIDPRDFENNIQVLGAQLDGAKATLEKTRLDFNRGKSLLAEQVISQASFDATKSAYETAAASVKNIQAQLQIARHQLSDTRLEAPFDGIISTKRVENHEMVAAGEIVMTILDISNLEFQANVPESEIVHQSLKKSQEAAVEFASLPGFRFLARLKEWSAAPDPATRTYKVTFVLPAPEEAQILPGMTGELFWQKENDASAVLSVPVEAVISDGNGGSAVWVFDSDASTASRRKIRTGGVIGKNRILVLEGLIPGEKIVTAGAAFVTEDMKLKPMPSR